MEEATTKASEDEIKFDEEDEIKFDEVHAYLSKGEYPPCVTKSQKCHKTESERLPTG